MAIHATQLHSLGGVHRGTVCLGMAGKAADRGWTRVSELRRRGCGRLRIDPGAGKQHKKGECEAAPKDDGPESWFPLHREKLSSGIIVRSRQTRSSELELHSGKGGEQRPAGEYLL